MPQKQKGWITFQSSEAERRILEQYCQQAQRTKTEVLRELLRTLNLSQMSTSPDMLGNLPDWLVQDEVDAFKQLLAQLERQSMKVSARNVLKGVVKQVVMGAVNAEVTLELAPGVEVVSIITKGSVEGMGLKEGSEAYAVIKSSDVMVAVE